MAGNSSYENQVVPLDQERREISVMHINIEHAGYVLIYMDEHETPLRYALHNHVEDAMQQAQVEYGVRPEIWACMTDRLPWKKRTHTQRKHSSQR